MPNKAVSFLPLGAGVSPFQNPELAEKDPEGLQGLGVTPPYIVKKEKTSYSLARVPFHTLGTSGTITHPATLRYRVAKASQSATASLSA